MMMPIVPMVPILSELSVLDCQSYESTRCITLSRLQGALEPPELRYPHPCRSGNLLYSGARTSTWLPLLQRNDRFPF